MTTLIGCRCKSGNIFSQALLIGRGLFLKKMNEAKQRSRLVEGQDEQAAERRFSNAAVVTKRKRSHGQIYDLTGGNKVKTSKEGKIDDKYLMQSSAYKLRLRIINASANDKFASGKV